MKVFILFRVSFMVFSLFSLTVFSEEEEIVFELKGEERKLKQPKKKKPLPLRFQRYSFTFSKDFVVFNERPKSGLKPGTVLKVNIPSPAVASFSEEFPVFGIVVSPFSGIVSGKIKGIKNTNKATLFFNEIIVNGEVRKIESFPVFLSGSLKEALFKDIFLNFFESLPSALALALGPKIPQSQVHFINTDLQNKMGKLSTLKQEKKRHLQYLEIKDIKLLKIVIK